MYEGKGNENEETGRQAKGRYDDRRTNKHVQECPPRPVLCSFCVQILEVRSTELTLNKLVEDILEIKIFFFFFSQESAN